MRIEITFTRTSLILLLLGIILALLFAERRNDADTSADAVPNAPDGLDPITTDAPYSNIGQTIAQNGSALLRQELDRRAREKAYAAGLNFLERQ